LRNLTTSLFFQQVFISNLRPFDYTENLIKILLIDLSSPESKILYGVLVPIILLEVLEQRTYFFFIDIIYRIRIWVESHKLVCQLFFILFRHAFQFLHTIRERIGLVLYPILLTHTIQKFCGV